MKIFALIAILALALAACAGDDATVTDGDDAGAGADGASIEFGGVADGDTVTSPFEVSFESDSFEIVPAGEGGEGTGHMHVMIDTDCVAVGDPIPNDETHQHFGDGSTSTELDLEPGEHTLCLQAGDANHIALSLSDTITVNVE